MRNIGEGVLCTCRRHTPRITNYSADLNTVYIKVDISLQTGAYLAMFREGEEGRTGCLRPLLCMISDLIYLMLWLLTLYQEG